MDFCRKKIDIKKLILLLLIPLVFGCSDDGESETVSLRDYLSSNIFLYDWGNGDYDFYEPILLESGLAKIHQFKFNNNGNPCAGEDEYTYDECYVVIPCAYDDVILISENDEQLLFNVTTPESSTYSYKIERQGNSLVWTSIGEWGENSTIMEMVSRTELENAMLLKNNIECDCLFFCN